MLTHFIPLAEFGEIVLLMVRLILGITMIYYGAPKVRDLRANAHDFEEMGFKPGILWGTLIAALEFVGGIVLLSGVFAWIIAALMVIHMSTGTLWKITKTDKGFPGWSYDILLAMLALIILTFGPGFSLLSL